MTNCTTRLLLGFCLLGSLPLHVARAADADPSQAESGERWIPLFNGEDLEGWTPKFTTRELGENYRNTFRVEDGLLRVCYDDWDKFKGEFGHLFYKTPYSHYRLRAEYRFHGDQVAGGPGWALRNNGLMISCQSPESMDLDQDFPNSIEVQLLGGLGNGPRGTLNICTPGTQLVLDGKLNKNHVIQTGGPTYDGDQWVTVEVEARGSDLVKHIADGKTVVEYSKPQLDDGTLLDGGYISIQAETHPIDFRNIELLPLPEGSDGLETD